MRIFFSAGEPSGDLHGANLVRAIQGIDPGVECVGFGGDKMAQAGCRLDYPLCNLAVSGFAPVLAQIHQFLDLVLRTDRAFQRRRPDALVLIDFPGFNWWMARRAHRLGIPVFYFVPPQIWAWARWRVNKMRRWVDHVLCSLPFEETWYRERGVDSHYVGHPYFDELPGQKLDSEFLSTQRARPGTIIGILPGSRNVELTANLPTLIRAARRIHVARPETRFLAACYKPSHKNRVQAALRGNDASFIEAHVGATPEIIEVAHSCMTVSGSVSLELLYRARPSVVTYRANPVPLFLSRFMRKCPYITLVNLLAEQELFPEFLSDRCEAKGVSERILGWLEDQGSWQSLKDKLHELRYRVAQPGACERGARYILDHVTTKVASPATRAA